MKTKIIQNIKSIILALILVVGVSYVSAYSTWVGPTATAPGNNADKPLDVTVNGQIKAGGLTLGSGGVTNGLIVQTGNVGIGTVTPGAKLDVNGQIKITGGTPGVNKVLTSDANGLATWGTSAADNLGNHIATQALNMNNNQIALWN